MRIVKTTIRLTLAAIAVCAAILIVAQTARADGFGAGRGQRAEVRFMEAMIDHHTMALDMADFCLKRAKTASVTANCQGVIDAQGGEIAQLRGWLKDWHKLDYIPMKMGDNTGGMFAMDHSSAGLNNVDIAGMMGGYAGLGRVEGVQFEIAWLENMIDHHWAAIDMSTRALKWIERPELKAFAEKVIKDQTVEIASMEAMITKLNG